MGAQASQLAACSTFQGSIAVATDAPDTVDFGNLGSIEGDLVLQNVAGVTTLRADTLTKVTGKFTMNNVTSLSTLSMQQLRGIGQGTQGGVYWQGLSNFQRPDFGSGIGNISVINIQNTQIQDLDKTIPIQAASVMVANNPALSSLNWPLRTCTNLSIAGNGPSTTGANVTLADLESVASISIRNASSLSLETLTECAGLLSISTAQVQYLIFPNLNSSSGVSIMNNPQLRYISFPALQQTYGALKLINNNDLAGIQSFPALMQLGGDLNITGAFTDVQMPAINTIRGTSYLSSTNNINSTCNRFGSEGTYAKTQIQGDSKCYSENQLVPGSGSSQNNTQGTSSSVNPNNSTQTWPRTQNYSGRGHRRLSSGAIAGIVVGIVVAVTIVSTAAWLFLRKWKASFARKKVRNSWFKPELSSDNSSLWKLLSGRSLAELPTLNSRAEVLGDGSRVEVPAEPVKLAELPAEEAAHEMAAK